MNSNMSFNVTQTIPSTLSSPLQSPRTLPAPSSQPQQQPTLDNERECWIVCRDRFKHVILMSVPVNFFMLMVYSIIMNLSLLNPVNWVKEFFTLPDLLLMLTVVTYGYFTLKSLLKEKIYYSNRMSKFIRSFTHEAAMLSINILIGIFTTLMFTRYLSDDFKAFTVVEEKKRFLNEKFTFLVLNGAYIRSYFYFKQRNDSLNFPPIYQSKALQLRRQIITVLKSSFLNSLLPACKFLGFYAVFGGRCCHILQRTPFMGIEDTSIIGVIATVINPRLVVYSWILSSLLWSNMEIMNQIVHLYATAPKEFPICGTSFTLADALAMSKFRITQQLAAQDLYVLADSPSKTRRKQYYELSIPGGHPHNWRRLVQNSIGVINSFTKELKATIDSISKTQRESNLQSSINQSVYHFYEEKRLVKDFNNYNGIRSLSSNPQMMPPQTVEVKPGAMDALKQRLLKNKIIFFFLGSNEYDKLDFLVVQNAQTISWVTQGLAGIMARSIDEDSYGVVQRDVKEILKSLIELKNMLDKCGTVSTVAKDRHFLALKAAVRRSLYRVVEKFSRFFDDLLIEPEDVRTLLPFVTYREL